MTTQKQATPTWLAVKTNDFEDTEPFKTSNVCDAENYTEEIQPSKELTDFEKKAKIIRWILRICTLGLCILMAATSVLGLAWITTHVNASAKLFVAIYMLFFSSLLFAFEMNEIKYVEWVDHMFRRNFGFLYNSMSKSFFIIFIAFLSFGLGDPQILSMATGFSLAIFGAGHLTLYLKYPEVFE